MLQRNLRKLAPALLLLGLSLSAITGCQNQGSGPAANTPAATRTVGAVDLEVLMGLDEFKKAQKDIDKLSDDFRKEAESKLPKNPRDWKKADREAHRGAEEAERHYGASAATQRSGCPQNLP